MEKRIKAAFFDVDWTLYDHHNRRYVPSGIEAIKRLKQKGVMVFVCSARPYESLKQFGVFDLGIAWDGYIACAGAYAKVGRKAIRKLITPKQEVRRLLRIARENSLCVQLVTPKTRFLTSPGNSYYEQYESVFRDWVEDVHPYSGEEVIGILVFSPKEFDPLFAAAFPSYSIFRFAEYGVDIMDVPHIKGDAINNVLDYLGIGKEDAIAVGDDVQDISMKGAVGTFICMGNGKDEAKKAADHVARRIEEDGLSLALEELGYLS